MFFEFLKGMFFGPGDKLELDRDDHFALAYIGGAITLIAVLMTVSGGMYAYRAQWETSRHDRAVAEAHKVADELTIMLFDGVAHLRKIQAASVGRLSWYEFYTGPYREYLEFKELWRRDLIIMHYKIQRYYGADIAKNLVDTEKLISGDKFDGRAVPSPCPSVPSEYRSYFVDAESIECNIRWSAYSSMELIKDSEDFLAKVGDSWEQQRNVEKGIDNFDRSTVEYIRAINSRLTSLGEINVEPIFDK